MEFSVDLDDDLDDEDQDVQRDERFHGAHLQSPISDFYLDQVDQILRQRPTFKRANAHPINAIGRFWQLASVVASVPLRQHLRSDVADEVYRAVASALLSYVSADVVVRLENCGYTERARALVGLSLQLDEVRNQTRSMDSPSTALHLGWATLRYERSYWNLEVGSLSSILSEDLFMMMCDAIHSRALILQYADMQAACAPTLCPTERVLLDVWAWGDGMLASCGNSAYAVIKMFEPIVLARLLEVTKAEDDPAICDPFIIQARQDLIDVPMEGAAMKCQLIAILQTLDCPDALNELMGIHKTWGHPCVDTPGGIEANRKVSCARKMVEPAVASSVTAMFHRIFLKNYYKKHHDYPPIKMDLLSVDNTIRDRLEHKEAIPSTASDGDLCEIHYDKAFQLEGLSMLDILSDKAIGPTLTQLKKCIENQAKMPLEERRALILFIKAAEINLLDELLTIDAAGGVPEEDCVIGVTPKERELKIKARLFSLLPMRLKCYFGGTEKLIATHILPYFPQITMKDDLFTLVNKLATAMGVHDSRAVLRLALNIDFEKWNMNFRHELVYGTFLALDELFGFQSLISQTHPTFERTQFHCHDGHHWPTLDAHRNVVQGPYAWKDQFGGVEGLRQKGWTVVTVCLVALAMRESGSEFSLTGQGDNQVLLVQYPVSSLLADGSPSREDKLKIKADFARVIRNLDVVCRGAGMPVKLNETWSSSSVFAYGKVVYLNGRPLPAGLKRISRMFTTSNELHPSLYGSLSAISANAQATGLQSSYSLLSYALATRQSQRCVELALDKHPGCIGGKLNLGGVRSLRLERRAVSRREVILAVLLGASVLGGYPAVSPLDGLSLGFPDMMSAHLTLLGLIRTYLPPDAQLIADNISRPVFSTKTPDPLMLALDPSSGNFLSGTTQANIIKRRVGSWLSGPEVKSRLISSLVNVQQSDDLLVATALLGCRPVDPTVMSFILSATPGSFAREFIGRFDNASSVRQLAVAAGRGVGVELASSEQSFFDAAMIQATCAGPTAPHKCPTKAAAWYRSESWLQPTLIGVTTPHPLSFLTHTMSSVGEHVTLCLDSKERMELLGSRGPYPPYLGSRGEPPRQQHNDYTAVDPEVSVKRLIRTIRSLESYVDRTDPVFNLLRNQWEKLTDYPYEALFAQDEVEVDPDISQIGRSILTHGGFGATLYTFSMHSWTDTSQAPSLARGTPASNIIHFQSVFLILNGIMANAAALSDKLERVYRFRLLCEHCVETTSHSFSGSELLRDVPLSDMRGVPGIWMPRETLAARLVRNRPPLRCQRRAVKGCTRAEATTVLAYLITMHIWGNRTATMHLKGVRNLRWVDWAELAHGVVSWTAATSFDTASRGGRSPNWTKQEFEGEVGRSLAMSDKRRWEALAIAVEWTGLLDNLDNCVPEVQEVHACMTHSEQGLWMQAYVRIHGRINHLEPIEGLTVWDTHLITLTAATAWGKTGRLNSQVNFAIQLIKAAARHHLEHALIPVNEASLWANADKIPDNQRRRIIEQILALTQRKVLPLALDQLIECNEYPNLLSPQRSQMALATLVSENWIDCPSLSVTSNVGLPKTVVLRAGLTAPPQSMGLHARVTEYHSVCVFSALQKRFPFGVAEVTIVGHGVAQYLFPIEKLGIPKVLGWEHGPGMAWHSERGDLQQDNLSLKERVGRITGDFILVLPNWWSQVVLWQQFQSLVSGIDTNAMVLVSLPVDSIVNATYYVNLLRTCSKSIHPIASKVRDDVARWYVLAEGIHGKTDMPPRYRVALSSGTTYSDWYLSLARDTPADVSFNIDTHGLNPRDAAVMILSPYVDTALELYTPADDLRLLMETRLVCGYDHRGRLGGVLRKRYKRSGVQVFDIHEAVIAYAAVRAAVGTPLKTGAIIGIIQTADELHLGPVSAPGENSHMLARHDLFSLTYSRVYNAALLNTTPLVSDQELPRQVDGNDSDESSHFEFPDSPDYCPSSPSYNPQGPYPGVLSTLDLSEEN